MSRTHIRITSSIPGFRRAGIAHSTEPTTYPITDFSDTQLAQLDAEPRLAVEFITVKADPSNDQAGAMEVDDVEVDLNSLTVERLKEIAALGEIDGYKTMKKAELILAIEDARDNESVVEYDASEG